MECDLPAQRRTVVEKAMPADGMRAATKKWDLGTSSGQLGARLHQLRERAEGQSQFFCSA